mmetsp:Transcript_8539/g.28424  ORF Transcript_8539/g.28424 Transcript_8539/m.28424 type:complete len:297 (-) Transcript_8539:393-1283(-)
MWGLSFWRLPSALLAGLRPASPPLWLPRRSFGRHPQSRCRRRPPPSLLRSSRPLCRHGSERRTRTRATCGSLQRRTRRHSPRGSPASACRCSCTRPASCRRPRRRRGCPRAPPPPPVAATRGRGGLAPRSASSCWRSKTRVSSSVSRVTSCARLCVASRCSGRRTQSGVRKAERRRRATRLGISRRRCSLARQRPRRPSRLLPKPELLRLVAAAPPCRGLWSRWWRCSRAQVPRTRSATTAAAARAAMARWAKTVRPQTSGACSGSRRARSRRWWTRRRSGRARGTSTRQSCTCVP